MVIRACCRDTSGESIHKSQPGCDPRSLPNARSIHACCRPAGCTYAPAGITDHVAAERISVALDRTDKVSCHRSERCAVLTPRFSDCSPRRQRRAVAPSAPADLPFASFRSTGSEIHILTDERPLGQSASGGHDVVSNCRDHSRIAADVVATAPTTCAGNAANPCRSE